MILISILRWAKPVILAKIGFSLSILCGLTLLIRLIQYKYNFILPLIWGVFVFTLFGMVSLASHYDTNEGN